MRWIMPRFYERGPVGRIRRQGMDAWVVVVGVRAPASLETTSRPSDYVEVVTDTLPMFPLNTVLFPGVSVPLTVFEDRYRALVHHLLRVEDPIERVFGSVGIREGYEVGDHGAQSLYRVGCRVQLTEVEAHPDGTFDVVAVGLERIQLDRLDTTGTFPVGHITARPDIESPVPESVLEQARIAFTAYRAALADIR